MDSGEAKFFRLNYLCTENPNSIKNQNLILERTIKNESKIRKVKSNIISVSQNFSSKKYKKIDNSKSRLNKNKSSCLFSKNHSFIRTKSGNEMTFNNSYFCDKTMSSLNPSENNKSFKKFDRQTKNENDTIFNQLNFTINNIIPLGESQYQHIKGKNKTYYIKIENPCFNRNKINNKHIYLRDNGKNLKTFFCLNNNSNTFNLDNKKEKEFKKDNIYKNNLSILNTNNKKDNNINGNCEKASKFSLSKFLNDKNSIRLLIKNKRKIRNYKIKKKENLLNQNFKTEYHSINLSNNINLSKNKIKEINGGQNKENERKKLNENKNDEPFTPIKLNKSFNVSKLIKKSSDNILNQEINKKNQIIKEKEEMIITLLNKYEQSKERIKYLEKNLEEIKKENDNLYKYKSLYDDKEIELIQYKNSINKYEIENSNYISLKYNYEELLNKYNKINEIKNEEINNLKNKYNDLYIKYNNIRIQLNELDELKPLKIKYNQLISQNEQLIEFKNKYNKIKNEYEDLKIIREKYGQILKEQKNLILIENKYNDLLEEIQELREFKKEYETVIKNKKSSESNLFKSSNISFGAENGII